MPDCNSVNVTSFAELYTEYVVEPETAGQVRSIVVPLLAVAVSTGGFANVVIACAGDVTEPYEFIATILYWYSVFV